MKRIDLHDYEITLLTKEEYEAHRERIPLVHDWWWLRSPGLNSDYAANVYDGGSVSDRGYLVDYDFAVRPALKSDPLTVINPIIEWFDRDVWEFIKGENIPYCELYNEGWQRLGCIGCPMARKAGREKEFLRWPKYEDAYLHAFDRMLRERKLKELNTDWKTAKDVYNWWMEYDILPGQVDMLEELEGVNEDG